MSLSQGEVGHMTRRHRTLAIAVGAFVAAVNTLVCVTLLVRQDHGLFAAGYVVLVFWIARAVSELYALDRDDPAKRGPQ
jgi:hypothetical protein